MLSSSFKIVRYVFIFKVVKCKGQEEKSLGFFFSGRKLGHKMDLKGRKEGILRNLAACEVLKNDLVLSPSFFEREGHQNNQIFALKPLLSFGLK